MTHKVLAVDERFAAPLRIRFVQEFIHEGFELVVPPSFDHGALVERAREASAIITAMKPITAEMINANPGLKAVGKAGTGVDSIDLAAASARKIPVVNAPGALRGVPVAEHAIALMLMLARRAWLWPTSERRLHVQLQGATLGVVGLGNIGRGVARRAAGFEMNVLAYTRTRGKFRPEGFAVEEAASLEEMLPRVDFLVLALPLNPETEGIIGAKELALMKETAFLVNVSRGRHVVTEALTEALREGRIAGAGLDVTEPEPLPGDHPLRAMPNVVLSPHIAAQTVQVQRESYRLLFDNIARAVRGERVTSLANPEIYA